MYLITTRPNDWYYIYSKIVTNSCQSTLKRWKKKNKADETQFDAVTTIIHHDGTLWCDANFFSWYKECMYRASEKEILGSHRFSGTLILSTREKQETKQD